MPDTYEVLFNGRIVPGADEQKVKQLTVKAFHASPEQLAKLFSGKAVILKSNLSKEAAQMFLKKLKGIGLMCEIRRRSQDKAEKKTFTPPKTTEPEKNTNVKSEHEVADTWSIAPAGADINPLKKPEAPPAPNTSQLELRPQQGFLVDPENKPTPQVPDTSHLSLEK